MKKHLKYFVLALTSIFIFSLSSFAQNGSYNHGKSFYTPDEVKNMLGIPIDSVLMKKAHAKQDSMYKDYLSKLKASRSNLHKTVTIPNWQGMMTHVKVQGCNNCWVYAAAAATEAQMHISIGSNIGVDLNEEELINNCQEGWCTWAEDFIQNTKMGVRASSYPNLQGVKWTLNSYNYNVVGIDAIKNALVNGPVTAAFEMHWDWSPFFANNPYGVYHYDGISADRGGHAVVIVSYYEDVNNPYNSYWLCKNSWGDAFADGGYVRMGFGECYIESMEKHHRFN